MDKEKMPSEQVRGYLKGGIDFQNKCQGYSIREMEWNDKGKGLSDKKVTGFPIGYPKRLYVNRIMYYHRNP